MIPLSLNDLVGILGKDSALKRKAKCAVFGYEFFLNIISVILDQLKAEKLGLVVSLLTLETLIFIGKLALSGTLN